MTEEMNEQHLILLKANSPCQNDSGSITEQKEKVSLFSKVISLSDEDVIIVVCEENTHLKKKRPVQ